MSSIKKNILLAAGGTAGLSIAAWRTFCPWIGYDIKTMKEGSKMQKSVQADLNNNVFVIDTFEATVKKFPTKTFIIYDDRCYTYEYVNEQACKVANIVLGWNLKRGDAVGIFAHNSPQYIWTYFGLQKVGVIVSFLNINIHGQSLENALEVTRTKAVIVGQEDVLLEAISSIKDGIDVSIYVMGPVCNDVNSRNQSWDNLMLTSSSAEIHPSFRSDIDMSATSCYIFTSGTTGLPKAAVLPHWRMAVFTSFMKILDSHPGDVIYDVLPFYHLVGIGGWLGVCKVGCSIVIRQKFSAAHFLSDCRKYKVTIVQYIGELCRYMLALPEDPKDTVHSIRSFIGNGLRKDIWIEMKRRFKIPSIVEYFGSSEGPSALINVCQMPGAVGRISPIFNKVDPTPRFLVKFDLATATPLRDKSGRCIQVKTGEPGLLISRLPPVHNGKLYQGPRQMSEKKLIRNAFEDGDVYFNFGDSMYMDKDYFLYFHDRVGDTFRWKGENVSTTEVSNVIMGLPFVLDANVYGVSVPGHDGKAGMVSVTLNNGQQPTEENLRAIYRQCEENLPRYARPIVLRFEREPRITVTYKQHKVDVMKEGFDPNIVSDPMFYISEGSKTYLPLNKSSYHLLLQSKL